jgi:hypothetical protein
MTKIIFLVLLGMSVSAQADDEWYDCSVNEFYVLSDDGKLESKPAGFAGEKFSVNRKDSVIVGDKINTIYNVDVVASNPEFQGIYSLVNYSRKDDGQIRRLSSLTVQDYGDIKPFVLLEGNYIFTGTCK